MSNKHDVTDQQVNFWCPIVLYAQFSKKADALGMTKSAVMTAFMLDWAGDIELTKEEIAKCKEKENENRRKRAQKG